MKIQRYRSGKILQYRKHFKRAVNLRFFCQILLNFASRTRNSWIQADLQKFASSSRVKIHINMFNLILKHVPHSFLEFLNFSRFRQSRNLRVPNHKIKSVNLTNETWSTQQQKYTAFWYTPRNPRRDMTKMSKRL